MKFVMSIINGLFIYFLCVFNLSFLISSDLIVGAFGINKAILYRYVLFLCMFLLDRKVKFQN